jgi:uncharacterized protein YecE (DUF72 family)
MNIYVGTSGWMYDWNKEGTLDWYVKNSGLNAVELNMSFYRFPTRQQIEKWRKYDIKWSIKVNKWITHIKRLTDMQSWYNFYNITKDLNPDFFLFQLSSSFKRNEINEKRVTKFAEVIGNRMAVEFRDPQWYLKPLNINAVIVSIDSPIGTYLINNKGYIYLRLHGRDNWYHYEYSKEELRQIATSIIKMNPDKVYIFFNNDHWMLENARYMLKILKEMV